MRTYLLDVDRIAEAVNEASAEIFACDIVGDLQDAAVTPDVVQRCVELVVALTKLASAGAQLWGGRSEAAAEAIVTAVQATRPHLRAVDDPQS